MNIIDKIQVSLKYTGFGEYPLQYKQIKSDIQNNFDVTVSYNGVSIKESYAVGEFDINGRELTESEMQLIKIDILNKIVFDFYIEDTFDQFMTKNNYDSNPMNVKYLREIYQDIVAQSKKLSMVFTDEDIEELKIALIEWRDQSPHKSIVNFDTQELVN